MAKNQALRTSKALLALGLGALLAVLPACKRSGPPPQMGSAVQDVPVQVENTGEADPIAMPEAKRGGSYTTWGGEYPKSLNMFLDYNSFSKEMTERMFEPLAELHSTQDHYVGILAQSWEISPDRKTFTFRIHPAAKWSDGRDVTAEDIQFFYDTIMDPKNLTSLFRVDVSRFARPEVVDAKTVRLTTQEVHWKMFDVAASFFALPKHVWAGKNFNDITFDFPVVSGPYALGEVKTNRSIQLKRRGDWWGRMLKYQQGKYNFDYMTYKSMEDRTKALEYLKKGEFDAYAVYTAKLWAQETNFPQVQKNWVVKQSIYNKEPVAFQGLALNMRRAQFSDVRVRQALNYLMNRELMNEKLMFNTYFLLNSYYPDLYPGNINPNALRYSYDPERARALLKEAGYAVNESGVLAKDGKPLSFVILYHGDDLRHLNVYVEDLKRVGIQVKIDVVSLATHTKRVDDLDFDTVWRNWSAARGRDPENMWYSKQAEEKATQNLSGVKDPEIDKLVEAQRTEMSLEKRNEILKQIDARLTALAPYVFLWQSDRTKLLYWNKFGTPKYVLDKFDREDKSPNYWWYDEAKAKALEEARAKDAALPALPAEVRYAE